jgi:predicted dehydrogenase
MDRGSGKNAVEDAMLVQLHCASGAAFNFDVTGAYVGSEERWWFETLSTRGSTRLAPLRVVKELHGRPTDVSPRGASARESAFIQSYRAELAHFVSVIAGETVYEAPTDQIILHKTVEAIYKSADDDKEVRL